MRLSRRLTAPAVFVALVGCALGATPAVAAGAGGSSLSAPVSATPAGSDPVDGVEVAGRQLIPAPKPGQGDALVFPQPLRVGASYEWYSRSINASILVEVTATGIRTTCEGLGKIVLTDADGVDTESLCIRNGSWQFRQRDETTPVVRVWAGPPSADPHR